MNPKLCNAELPPRRATWPPEVRRNEDGSIDEIVAYGPNGECIFHLEQMDEGCWWFAIYPPNPTAGKRGLSVVIHSASGRAKVEATITEEAQ